MGKSGKQKVTRRAKSSRGLFITFEGIDGCGKSTQLNLTARFLTSDGYDVLKLREPGSTAVSERIRRILLDKRLDMSDTTELLLYEAARAELVVNEIEPALRKGAIVLCDRFYDSTTAYQGFGRGLDINMIKRLHRIAVGDVQPNMTLVFDIDLKTGLTRVSRKPDRLESQSKQFFSRVRKGFLEIARTEPRRVKVINARRSIEVIFDDVRKHVTRRLHRL
jgi:dTMP kinase